MGVFSRGTTRISGSLSCGARDALEKEMATHSSVLAWRIPGTGEPGGLPFMGSHHSNPLSSANPSESGANNSTDTRGWLRGLNHSIPWRSGQRQPGGDRDAPVSSPYCFPPFTPGCCQPEQLPDTRVSIQSLVEVKDLLRIRSLLARQCLAELLAVFVLTVGGLIEGEERKEVGSS